MDIESLAAIVVDHVCTADHVSMVEVIGLMKSHIETKGDYDIHLGADPNVVIWANVSDEFVQVFQYVTRHELVRVQPASLLTYLIDGGLLNMPLAKRLPKSGYKRPHWLPVVLRPGNAIANKLEIIRGRTLKQARPV